jgi:hypothetical protein
MPDSPDVVVGNCYSKTNEAMLGKVTAQALLPDNGGTLVLITNNPWGEVCHYFRRHFGHHITGRGWKEPELSPKIKKFILQMPYRNKASLDWIAPPETVTWVKTWEDVVAILEADYPDGARVAVIPDVTIQYFDAVATVPYIERILR